MDRNLKWGTALFLALATMAAPALADDDWRDHRDRHGYSHDDDDGYDDRDDDRYDWRHDRRHDRRDHRRDRRDYRRASRDYRHDDRHDYRHGYWHRPPVRVVHHRPVVRHVYHRPTYRYAGPPRWARGGYIHHYDRPIHVVNDYYGYGLRHPPRGYRWYRDDYGDYLLVAIATGLIADLILRD